MQRLGSSRCSSNKWLGLATRRNWKAKTHLSPNYNAICQQARGWAVGENIRIQENPFLAGREASGFGVGRTGSVRHLQSIHNRISPLSLKVVKTRSSLLDTR